MPNVSAAFLRTVCMTTSDDAAHFQRIGLQSYGTTLEVVMYDGNHLRMPICFAQSVGTESDVVFGR